MVHLPDLSPPKQQESRTVEVLRPSFSADVLEPRAPLYPSSPRKKRTRLRPMSAHPTGSKNPESNQMDAGIHRMLKVALQPSKLEEQTKRLQKDCHHNINELEAVFLRDFGTKVSDDSILRQPSTTASRPKTTRKPKSQKEPDPWTAQIETNPDAKQFKSNPRDHYFDPNVVVPTYQYWGSVKRQPLFDPPTAFLRRLEKREQDQRRKRRRERKKKAAHTNLLGGADELYADHHPEYAQKSADSQAQADSLALAKETYLPDSPVRKKAAIWSKSKLYRGGHKIGQHYFLIRMCSTIGDPSIPSEKQQMYIEAMCLTNLAAGGAQSLDIFSGYSGIPPSLAAAASKGSAGPPEQFKQMDLKDVWWALEQLEGSDENPFELVVKPAAESGAAKSIQAKIRQRQAKARVKQLRIEKAEAEEAAQQAAAATTLQGKSRQLAARKELVLRKEQYRMKLLAIATSAAIVLQCLHRSKMAYDACMLKRVEKYGNPQQQYHRFRKELLEKENQHRAESGMKEAMSAAVLAAMQAGGRAHLVAEGALSSIQLKRKMVTILRSRKEIKVMHEQKLVTAAEHVRQTELLTMYAEDLQSDHERMMTEMQDFVTKALAAKEEHFMQMMLAQEQEHRSETAMRWAQQQKDMATREALYHGSLRTAEEKHKKSMRRLTEDMERHAREQEEEKEREHAKHAAQVAKLSAEHALRMQEQEADLEKKLAHAQAELERAEADISRMAEEAEIAAEEAALMQRRESASSLSSAGSSHSSEGGFSEGGSERGSSPGGYEREGSPAGEEDDAGDMVYYEGDMDGASEPDQDVDAQGDEAGAAGAAAGKPPSRSSSPRPSETAKCDSGKRDSKAVHTRPSSAKQRASQAGSGSRSRPSSARLRADTPSGSRPSSKSGSRPSTRGSGGGGSRPSSARSKTSTDLEHKQAKEMKKQKKEIQGLQEQLEEMKAMLQSLDPTMMASFLEAKRLEKEAQERERRLAKERHKNRKQHDAATVIQKKSRRRQQVVRQQQGEAAVVIQTKARQRKARARVVRIREEASRPPLTAKELAMRRRRCQLLQTEETEETEETKPADMGTGAGVATDVDVAANDAPDADSDADPASDLPSDGVSGGVSSGVSGGGVHVYEIALGKEAAQKRRIWQVKGEVARLQRLEQARRMACAATFIGFSAYEATFAMLEPLRELLNLVEAKNEAERLVVTLKMELQQADADRRKAELEAKLLRVDLSSEAGRREAAERSLGMQSNAFKNVVAKRERALEKLKTIVADEIGVEFDPDNPVPLPPKSKRLTYVDPDAGLSANQKRRKQSAQWKKMKNHKREAMMKMKGAVDEVEKKADWGITVEPPPEPKKRDGPEFRLLIRHEIQRGQEQPPSPGE